MLTAEEKVSINPNPRPFPMDAIQLLTKCELSCAQQKAIAILELQYFKNCALEEVRLIDGIIRELENLSSKV